MSEAPHPAIHTAPEAVSIQMAGAREKKVAQTLVLSVLFAVPSLCCAHLAVVGDPDVWWHLSTGEWILQRGTVPHVDPFSSSATGKPWEAYSWIFDILIVRLFNAFGLTGIVAYSSAMVVAITAVLHRLIRHRQSDGTLSIVLTLLGAICLGHLFTPRPWLFSILFFILEIDILMTARRSGRARHLVWLPVLFALWANLHIQFVVGLIVLGLALVESFAARLVPIAQARLKPAVLALTISACVLATFANPYGWRLYKTAWELAAEPGVLNQITELHAMPFREFPEFCLLFLALGAAAALARTRHLQPFETVLLLFAAVVSFRSQRDCWILATVAIALIARACNARTENGDGVEQPEPLARYAYALSGLVAGAALALGFPIMHIDSADLQRRVAAEMPVAAVDFVLQHGYRGPLYNDFGWGGYLIWALRQPVSIDGRAALHGDGELGRSLAVENAAPGWDQDSKLASAHLVILPVKAPLMQVLRLDSKYKIVYEDNVAAVLISQ